MSRARSRNHSKQDRRPVAPETAQARVSSFDRVWAVAGLAVAAGLAAILLVRLAGQAAHAHLYTDECFHAYAAEWIARHHTIPADFPEFYAGYYYYYPPLLHLLGAAWTTIFGVSSIDLLNVALFGLLLVAAACPIVPGVPAAPRRWAVLLLVAHQWLALYAVRFYVEMLITLLSLLVALLIFRFQKTTRMPDAIWLGVATGLSLVAKQTGVVLAVAVAGCAVGAAFRRDRDRLRGYLLACALALVISLPYFVRNALLFGSPIYPVGGAVTQAHLWALRLKPFHPPPASFYRAAFSAIGPVVLAMAGAALAVAAWRRRVGVLIGVAVVAAVVFVARQMSTWFEVRHVMPLIALLAVGGSAIVWGVVARMRPVAVAIEAALIVMAGLWVMQLDDLRAGVDVPPKLEAAYAVMRDSLPENATVLSLWTYDTFYYTRRPAVWPVEVARGEQPFELFYESDPDRFLSLLHHYKIDYMLLPIMRPLPVFTGGNYPQSFMDCVEVLGLRGSLTKVWQSDRMALVATAPPRPPPAAR